MNRRVTLALATAVSAALLGLGAPAVAGAAPASPTPSVHVAADAATAARPKPRAYKNCTALNRVYKHGVARKGARDRVKGSTKPVRNFTVDTATYKLNTKSDRDKDGVACEKR